MRDPKDIEREVLDQYFFKEFEKNIHAVELGRKGGLSKSEKKANASRENGKKNKGKRALSTSL